MSPAESRTRKAPDPGARGALGDSGARGALGGSGARGALGELTAALAGASDEKLARIVAVLEGTAPEAAADRGLAEALIAPLRPRLAQLRPRRRPSLARLAFSPLDPVIVPAARWSRDSIGVPRTALGPLWTTIRAGLAARGAEMRAAMAAGAARAECLGPALWPRAAAILREAPPPAQWRAATGLEEADHGALAGRIAALLAQAPELAAMEAELLAGKPPTAAGLAAWLAPLAAAPRPALGTAVAILLARLPRAEAVMALADDPARLLGAATPEGARAEMAAATEAAIGFALDAIVAGAPAQGGDAGAEAARQAVLLLLGLEARAQERPTRLARIRAARHAVDARLRADFAGAIAAQLAASRGAGPPDAALEASALALRRFAGVARHLGSEAAYDTALREAAAALTPPPGADLAARVARARLVEILAGSEAAAAVLAPAG